MWLVLSIDVVVRPANSIRGGAQWSPPVVHGQCTMDAVWFGAVHEVGSRLAPGVTSGQVATVDRVCELP